MSSPESTAAPSNQSVEPHSNNADDAVPAANASSNPSIRFALERLCSRESKEVEDSFNEKRPHDSLQSLEPCEAEGETKEKSQCIEVNNSDDRASTLQSLSPNEQQLPPGSQRYLNQKPRSSNFRPISLLVKRSSRSSDEEDEDQATFEDCFFDLLFSASLSVYGSAANLTCFDDVGQFMSFFTLLWWSWCE